MKKFAFLLAVFAALVLVPAGASAKDCHKKKQYTDRRCSDDYRYSRYYQSYPVYPAPCYSAPRAYMPYRSYGYSHDCDRRSYSYRPSSGFWISFN